MKYTERRILQIMPADGWAAVFIERHKDGDYMYIYYPLIGWALVKDKDGCTYMTGISCEPPEDKELRGYNPTSFVDEASNFVGYERFTADGSFYSMKIEEGAKK